MTEIEKVKSEIKVLEKKLSFLEELSQTKSPAEEAYKNAYGVYPTNEITYNNMWSVFQKGYYAAQKDYKVGEYQEPEVKKLQEKEWSYKIADEHGELNPYKQGLNMIKKDKKTEELMTSKGYEKNSAGFWEPKPQSENEVAEGLRSAMRKAKEDGVFDTTKENTDNFDDLIEGLMKDPPSFLKFELGKTLEQLIERWWCDVFSGPHENWTMEECISDLCDRIFLWLPKEQDSSGTQRIETIVAVDTHNELLRKIKSKIHNKKV